MVNGRYKREFWEGSDFLFVDSSPVSPNYARYRLANISRLDILLCREDLSRSLWKDLVELNIMVLDRKAE